VRLVCAALYSTNPRDFQDHEGDKEPDDRVGDWCSGGDEDCACDYAERDEAVDAGVVPVRDECWALEPVSCS
jgi:hypothetical protein